MTQLDTSSRARGNYDLVVALFAVLLLISNVAAAKLIVFGPEWSPFGLPVLPIIADDDMLLFLLIYTLGDVLTEVFGMRGARCAILLGFEVLLLTSLTFLVVGAAPMALGYENQKAFIVVFDLVLRIVVAPFAGCLVGQLLNAWVPVKLKQ